MDNNEEYTETKVYSYHYSLDIYLCNILINIESFQTDKLMLISSLFFHAERYYVQLVAFHISKLLSTLFDVHACVILRDSFNYNNTCIDNITGVDDGSLCYQNAMGCPSTRSVFF